MNLDKFTDIAMAVFGVTMCVFLVLIFIESAKLLA